MSISWPPDPTSALPVIEVLDIVFLWCLFAVTTWSAMGCVGLRETGGVDRERRSEGGRRRIEERLGT